MESEDDCEWEYQPGSQEESQNWSIRISKAVIIGYVLPYLISTGDDDSLSYESDTNDKSISSIKTQIVETEDEEYTIA